MVVFNIYVVRSTCQWCRSEDNCVRGGGGGADVGCRLSFQWERCRSIHPLTDKKENGGGVECHKSRDCRGCKRKDGCVWTRRKLANSDRFRWDCLTKSAVEKVDGTQLLIPWQCPASCPERATCAECLAGSPENADPRCVWSEESKSCLPPSAVPLHCFGGANCGRLFEDGCPAPWEVLSVCRTTHSQRELPDMMSASEGEGGHGKADVVRKDA